MFQCFSSEAKEVKFSIINENGSLYFETNDKKWFSQLFKNTTDGLAIDVVAKDIYDCNVTTIERGQISGTLL